MTGAASIHRSLVGREELPVLVIDNVLAGAERLVSAAKNARWHVKSPYYPGIRAPSPQGYAEALARVLSKPVTDAFGLSGGHMAPTESSFSLVTTAPDGLVPFQRVPHFDGVDPHTFAVLHFVCDADGSGTAFYRHRATGFESVDQDRYQIYRQATDREVAEHGPPPSGYLRESNDRYEQIAKFDALFNRLLVYQGHALHCGYIPEDFSFDADPAKGRLTVNTFLQYHP